MQKLNKIDTSKKNVTINYTSGKKMNIYIRMEVDGKKNRSPLSHTSSNRFCHCHTIKPSSYLQSSNSNKRRINRKSDKNRNIFHHYSYENQRLFYVSIGIEFSVQLQFNRYRDLKWSLIFMRLHSIYSIHLFIPYQKILYALSYGVSLIYCNHNVSLAKQSLIYLDILSIPESGIKFLIMTFFLRLSWTGSFKLLRMKSFFVCFSPFNGK